MEAYFCELLIKSRAKINKEDIRGYTALEYVFDQGIRDSKGRKNVSSTAND
jgi:hypothetical protein